MPDTLTIITALAHPALRHLVEPEASLASLGLDAIDRTYTLPIEIEERLGIFPPDREIERWQTVRCVMDTVEGMRG